MHLLITGANGFVGKNLIPYLQQHIPGVVITTLGRSKLNADLSWSGVKPDDLKTVDAVIHLAGKAHDTKNASAAEEYFKVNTELTRKLFDLFLESPAEKFIYLSSVKAAADKVDGILTEDVTPAPQTVYGKSKLDAENYMLQESKGTPKQFYILRPCMIHGPGNKGNLNLLYRFVKKGVPYPLAAFENRRSFLSVDNLCFVIEQLLRKHVGSGIYNVADDEALPTTELIRTIAAANNKNARMLKIFTRYVQTLAKMGDLLRLPLNSERLEKLTENYVVSNEKIKRALGIVKMPVQAKEGLMKTVRSFV